MKELEKAPKESQPEINKILHSLLWERFKYPIQTTKESRRLANKYRKSIDLRKHDPLIVADTVIEELDGIITWDTKHLAKPRIETKLNETNEQNGLRKIFLMTPEQYISQYPFF